MMRNSTHLLIKEDFFYLSLKFLFTRIASFVCGTLHDLEWKVVPDPDQLEANLLRSSPFPFKNYDDFLWFSSRAAIYDMT